LAQCTTKTVQAVLVVPSTKAGLVVHVVHVVLVVHSAKAGLVVQVVQAVLVGTTKPTLAECTTKTA
jgi:hypothetical protein